MAKFLLVTGATGKQGGAVIEALSQPEYIHEFALLAVTRNITSAKAQKLASKYPNIRLVQGDLNDVPSLFASAKEIAGQAIWGVFSVQIPSRKLLEKGSETKQGTDLIDESVEQGIEHFVYSSVDRGGDKKSWDTPTPIPHFQTKHKIEHYLRDSAGTMGWTILRPVAFMENLELGLPTKVFMTALRDTLGGKPLQWVTPIDIGVFAAKAFASPPEWNHKALGIAGDELNFDEISRVFQKTTGAPLGTTYSFLGSALKWGVTDLGVMIDWFESDGYRADIAKLRRIHPGLMNMETWIEKKSKLVQR